MAPSLASSQKPDEVIDDIVLSMEAPGTNPSAHTQIFDWVAPVARAVQNRKNTYFLLAINFNLQFGHDLKTPS